MQVLLVFRSFIFTVSSLLSNIKLEETVQSPRTPTGGRGENTSFSLALRTRLLGSGRSPECSDCLSFKVYGAAINLKKIN